MIQKQSLLEVIDNTGAKAAMCIHLYPGNKKRYSYFSDQILLTIKSIRIKRREFVKANKGELYKGIIVKTKAEKKMFSGDSFSYGDVPSVILLTKQNKFLGTRVTGSLNKLFRFTKYLKLLTLSSGIHIP